MGFEPCQGPESRFMSRSVWGPKDPSIRIKNKTIIATPYGETVHTAKGRKTAASPPDHFLCIRLPTSPKQVRRWALFLAGAVS